LVAGKRTGYGSEEFKPHNLSSVFLGTALLWFGWFGFNGGSELAANARAVLAIVNTNLSAAVGGLTWVFLDYRLLRKFRFASASSVVYGSAFGFCTGVVAGLVSITPGGTRPSLFPPPPIRLFLS
jgi:Amt family ammonium transporter